MELVTLDEARAHLRLDADSAGGPDDAWLALFIPAVSGAVAQWMKEEWRMYVPEVDSAGDIVLDSAGNPIPALDSSGMPILLPQVRAAVLLELASLYRYRDGEGVDNVVQAHEGYGYALNKASTAILSALRKPTLAP